MLGQWSGAGIDTGWVSPTVLLLGEALAVSFRISL